MWLCVQNTLERFWSVKCERGNLQLYAYLYNSSFSLPLIFIFLWLYMLLLYTEHEFGKKFSQPFLSVSLACVKRSLNKRVSLTVFLIQAENPKSHKLSLQQNSTLHNQSKRLWVPDLFFTFLPSTDILKKTNQTNPKPQPAAKNVG